MVSLARALKDYQEGTSTETDLVEQVVVILRDGRARPQSLLDTLESHVRERGLPEMLHEKIRGLITGSESVDTAPGEAFDATELSTSIAGGEDHGETRPSTAPIETVRTTPKPSSEADPALPGPGDTLSDRFVLEELIGQGGMSQVFRATDKFKVRAGSRTPEVAVKLMDVSGLAEDNAFMVVQREVQKLQRLTHENIVRVIEGYQDPSGVLFITMEYLTGRPLSRLIAELGRRPLPLDDAMSYIRQMGNALQHAHSQRIVHADFKPSNAFLTDDGKLKVIDFGIARAFQHPEDNPEDRTVFDPRELGALTPAYASPEMIEGLEPDPRDDVYSLGCVAYELLTGRHPYGRAQSTVARQEGMEPARPSGLNRRQWRSLRSALALDRDSRTPTIDEFLHGLLPAERATPWGLIAGGAVLVIAGLGIAFWPRPEPGPAVEPAARPEQEPALSAPVEEEAPEPISVARHPEPGTILRDCADCPEVVVVPAGSARIGLGPGAGGLAFEGPAHQVTFAGPFAIGTGEISVAEFGAFIEATGRTIRGCRTADNHWQEDSSRSWRDPGFVQSDDHPVTCVSWLDARDYAAWLTETTGARYRLPSEAEWEYAARGGEAARGSTAESPAGSSSCEGRNVADLSTREAYPGLTIADCNDGFVHTAPLSEGQSNGFALRHALGNLFEWTEDCWSPRYENATADGAAMRSGNCDYHVLRGGSWFTAPSALRLTYRNHHPATARANTFGFRVVRELGNE